MKGEESMAKSEYAGRIKNVVTQVVNAVYGKPAQKAPVKKEGGDLRAAKSKK